MRRRTFFSLAGIPAVAAFSNIRMAYSESMSSSSLIDTPEKRTRYSIRLLKEMCTDLGPCPSGSESYNRRTEIILNELLKASPLTEYDHYSFEMWQLVDEAELYIGSEKMETFIAEGCSGTEGKWLEGIPVKDRASYNIVDRSSGETLFVVSVSGYGRALSRMAPPHSIASYSIGRQDVPFMEEAVAKGTSCRARGLVRFVPDTISQNVICTIPGSTKEEILFLAHADTKYNTEGANDNTASVIVMMILAHAFSGITNRRTLRFVATGSEEYQGFGAKNYGRVREKDGTMGDIKVVVNFDSLTYGPVLHVNTLDPELASLVKSITTGLGFPEPRINERDGFVMDSAPFRSSGGRGMHVNSRGYDGITLPAYHRPEDVPAVVGLDCVENSFLVFREFITRAQTL